MAAEPTIPAHETVYRTLRARIMYGEMEPASALTLRGIGAEFGVSMTPAREAVRRLVAEGALNLSASGAFQHQSYPTTGSRNSPVFAPCWNRSSDHGPYRVFTPR